MDFDCPYCTKTCQVDGEDLPDAVCDDELYECVHCEREMKIGWYATAEVRQTFDQDDCDGGGL